MLSQFLDISNSDMNQFDYKTNDDVLNHLATMKSKTKVQKYPISN